jgi:hypothetical protein
MTGRADTAGHQPGEFAKARAQAELDTRTLRVRAARTVADQAINDDDRTQLLSMLGLDDTPERPGPGPIQPADGETVSLQELERGLAGYVHAVATELGVPKEATGFEISDTITAYLGLPDRHPDCPHRDLMLVWNERDGWLVAAETHPTEPIIVIGYLGGYDILPHPRTVARFVGNLRTGFLLGRPRPTYPPLTARDLATLLGRHPRTPTGRLVAGSPANPLL